MDENEILEGNKLIAEFMGLNYAEQENWDKSKYKGWINSDGERCGEYLREYNSSWDLLMPVVEEIQKERVVIIASQNDKEHRCSIGIGWITVINKVMINAVWKAVVEFIKWYNQNKS